MRVVVVGAGVLGASVACHLTLAGVSVTVIDADRDGRATQAGAGILCPWLSAAGDGPFSSLYEGGAEYYPELIEVLGDTDAIGYRRSGAVYVSDDATELAAIMRIAQAKSVHAPGMGKIERLSPPQTRALFPPLAPDLGGVWIAGGARVDGRALVAALLARAAAEGAQILHGTAALIAEHGRVVGVRRASGVLHADVVVAANGAWAPALLAPLGIDLAIAPQKGQILHLALPGQDTRDWPVVLPPGSHYLLAFDGGRIVAGATRETGAGFDHRVTAAGQAELLDHALSIAPGLGAASVVETRVGFRPAGPSVRPMLGWAPGVDGLVIGNGLGAGGLTMGPYAGKLLADLIMDAPTLDLSPFDPFTAERPPSGPALR